MAFTSLLCNLLQTGRKPPGLRGAYSHLSAHNGGLGDDGGHIFGEEMCGPGTRCCVRRGAGRAGPSPQSAQQSRGSAGPRRGVPGPVRERYREGRERCREVREPCGRGTGVVREPCGRGEGAVRQRCGEVRERCRSGEGAVWEPCGSDAGAV